MRRVVALGVAAVSAAVLWAVPAGARTASAGNGEAAKDAAAILADAKVATGGAQTLRISGTVKEDGKTMSLDLVSGHGSGGGTIRRDGSTIRIVVHPPNVYLKADAASWTKLAGTPAAGQLLAGKWLQTTTDDSDFGSFAKLLDASALADGITSTGAVTKGKTTTYRGKKAIPLVDGDENGTLYVAATGAPYILGVVGSGSKQGSEIRFTQYDTAKIPAEPSNSISVSAQKSSGA
jgi:hypothetical protein